MTLTYFIKWVVQDPTEKSPLYDLEAVLVVYINYFFPYTEILTSQVAAKLLITYHEDLAQDTPPNLTARMGHIPLLPVPHWSGNPAREAEPTTITTTAGSTRIMKMQTKTL